MGEFYPLLGSPPAQRGNDIAPDPGPGGGGVVVFHADTASIAAAKEASERSAGRVANANLLRKISETPCAIWVGGWNGGTSGDFSYEVAKVTAYCNAATALGRTALICLYAIPDRDGDGASAGGLADRAAYQAWLSAMAGAIGSTQAWIFVEPDAVAMGVPEEGKAQRYGCLNDAMDAMTALPNTKVFLDAGMSTWPSLSTAVTRLPLCGVDKGDGICLNVSNFQLSSVTAERGDAIMAALPSVGGYVIDTSRNGNGPGTTQYNPPGRALGVRPRTTDLGLPAGCVGEVWVKLAGTTDSSRTDSSGTFLATGAWDMERALEMAANAAWTL